MTRFALIAAIFCGMLAASSAPAASLVEVPRADWMAGVTFPTYLQMWIYVPDNLVANPSIVVSCHSCGGSHTVQLGNMSKVKAEADKSGYIILIIPDNPGRSCWDAGSAKSLTHDGGGETHAIANMVRYAISKYKADPKRVYINGGSSGGMMTQAMLGVYPELFMAGASRAGVPCYCWNDGYNDAGQWSNNCAGGKTIKTAQAWGDLVRGINPNYTGHRPRVQLYHGTVDGTINYNNMLEGIKEWTNVLGLNTNPDKRDTIKSSGYTYNRQLWKNKCGYIVFEAWSAPGMDHSMTYEQDSMMKFYGVNVPGGKDPELAVCDVDARRPSGEGGKNGGHTLFAFKENALVLSAMPSAEEASIIITNISGRILYRGKHLVRSPAISTSVPVSFLHSGYYFASAVIHKRNKPVGCFKLSFVLMN
jgi:poly(hydroxyalkanoate) depolymerase family esterase